MGRTVWTLIVGVAFAGSTTDLSTPDTDPDPLPVQPGEPAYDVRYLNTPFREVAEDLERLTGVMYLSRDVPDVRITIRVRGSIGATELFDRINDQLEAHGWVVLREKQSFAIHPNDVPIPRSGGYPRHVSLEELSKRPKHEQVVFIVAVDDAETAITSVKPTCGPTISLNAFSVDKLILHGTAKDIRVLVAALGDHIRR